MGIRCKAYSVINVRDIPLVFLSFFIFRLTDSCGGGKMFLEVTNYSYMGIGKEKRNDRKNMGEE